MSVEARDEGGVWVSTGTIYAKLVDVERKVDLLVAENLARRVRALEQLRWALPANFLVGLAGIVAAFQRTRGR